MRAPPRRRRQDRRHRHADREHADGSVVAAVDHRARACSRTRSASTTPTRPADRSGRRDPSCWPRCGGGSAARHAPRTKDAVLAELPPKTEQIARGRAGPAPPPRSTRPSSSASARRCSGSSATSTANRFEILELAHPVCASSPRIPALVDDEHADVARPSSTRWTSRSWWWPRAHRALVFSQFTRYLAHVRVRLDAAGIGHSYLDGETRNRDEVIARFKDGDVPVFVISLKAGGFGLNLTEADYCFVLDPWWNPAAETQAVDRTHRIGQTRSSWCTASSPGHHRGEGHGAQGPQGRAVRQRHGRRRVFGGGLDADDIRGLLA